MITIAETVAKAEAAIASAQAELTKLEAHRERAVEQGSPEPWLKAAEGIARKRETIAFHTAVLEQARAAAADADRAYQTARLLEITEQLGGPAYAARFRPAAEQIAAAMKSALEAYAAIGRDIADAKAIHQEGQNLARGLGVLDDHPVVSRTRDHERAALGLTLTAILRTALAAGLTPRVAGLQMDHHHYVQLVEADHALQFMGIGLVRDRRFPVPDQLEAALEGRFHAELTKRCPPSPPKPIEDDGDDIPDVDEPLAAAAE